VRDLFVVANLLVCRWFQLGHVAHLIDLPRKTFEDSWCYIYNNNNNTNICMPSLTPVHVSEHGRPKHFKHQCIRVLDMDNMMRIVFYDARRSGRGLRISEAACCLSVCGESTALCLCHGQ